MAAYPMAFPLTAYDGLDALRLTRFIEAKRTVKHAVVGDGDGGMSRRLCRLGNLGNTASAV